MNGRRIAEVENDAWLSAERARMGQVIARHDKIVLQFSGGKDSLACLYLLREFLPKITVVWVNSGDAFPETMALMSRVRAIVPNFLEIQSNQPAQIATSGWPVDLIPVVRTPLGRILHRHDDPIMQGYPLCCDANLWVPMSCAIAEIGATLIIRGSKSVDARKAPDSDGLVHAGLEYLLPVQDWSHDDVFAFLRREGAYIPEHYASTLTSLDCVHCTAFLDENAGKMRFMQARHPDAFREVQRRLVEIREAARSEIASMDAAII